MSEIIKGNRVQARTRAPKQLDEGRVCLHEGCETLLSRYNKRTFCYAHAPTRFPRLRGRVVPES
ncbi:MAG: hypothetical protein QY307_04955 [Acidimicrobiia bacterium]|nr:MAG: hypothetical protein QY307_04955 [Acidimicrobiia bacterium]